MGRTAEPEGRDADRLHERAAPRVTTLAGGTRPGALDERLEPGRRGGRGIGVDQRGLAEAVVRGERFADRGAPSPRRGRQVRPHGRDAGGGERVGLAVLLVEIAPFRHRQPRPPGGEHLLAGRVAGRGDHQIRRGDVLGRGVDPAAMFEIARLGRMPVALDRADGDPALVGKAARADADRRLREAAAAAAGDDEHHAFVETHTDTPPRGVAVDPPRVDAESGGETGLGAHARVPVRLRERGMERGEQADRAVIGGPVAGVVAIAVLQHLHMRHAADPRELGDLRRDVADHQRGIGRAEPAGDLRHRGADAGPADGVRNAACRASADERGRALRRPSPRIKTGCAR